MSQDTPDDAPFPPAPPSLRKDPAEALPAEPSIWEPLDGSAPKLPPAPVPGTGAWGQPHQPGAVVPPPHQVAAAYAANANAQNAGVFTLAGWGPRFGAFLIDSLLFGIVVFAFLIPASIALGLTFDQATRFLATAVVPDGMDNAAALYAVFVVGRVALGVIPALFLANWDGQTPGKRAVGLRVMTGSGAPLTLQIAMRRELLGRAIVLQIVGVVTFGIALALNYFWPLWDPQRRAGYDFLADTRVVVAPKSARPLG